jgi:large subunit ribosomal protein L1
MMKVSKRHNENHGIYEKDKRYPLGECVTLLRKFKKTRFNETVDLAIKLGIDPSQADQQIRGSFSLPHGTGKAKSVVVFARGDKAEEARQQGADRVGSEDLVKEIEGGWMDFDVAIATPDMMPFVGKLGRILGPQGKMPSPKSGTVTDHISTAVKEYKSGRIEYRNDKTGNLHAPVGQLSFSDEQLEQNISAFLEHVQSLKPSSSKGAFVRNATVSSSMSPGVKIQVTD